MSSNVSGKFITHLEELEEKKKTCRSLTGQDNEFLTPDRQAASRGGIGVQTVHTLDATATSRVSKSGSRLPKARVPRWHAAL
jgi:hypothetical protein